MMMTSEDVGLVTPTELTDPQKDDPQRPAHFRQSLMLQLIDDLSYEDVKKCYRGSTVSKYNSQYHKLFSAVPKEEILMKVYSCALLRDILLQGRLYISRNWLCFYANLFGKDIKVCVPVVSVRLVKKHKTAGLVPNGLVITTDSSQKYVFVSLLSMHTLQGSSERRLEAEKVLLTEPESELGHMEYHLLKFFILLIILLIFSSCYLAFRVCSLEQQLSLLNTQPAMSVRER
ncbi:GRAM domain-containing protein 2A-like [Cyprinus carpio]|uniref:GRAM domain-containing protein 2A-like n=1 Tax=Cyprinus carpio TaxID=7962 RepID=A0A9Q9VV99_CYPCA|nr:GRAM domain-containing protein 2A-like [Cyprinus carpio]